MSEDGESLRALVFVLGLFFLLPVSVATGIPQYHTEVLGAWNKTDGKVRVSIQVAGNDLRQEILRGVAEWKESIDAYAEDVDMLNLQLIHFETTTAISPEGCESSPSHGRWQQLALPNTQRTVCVRAPQAVNTMDIIIAEFGEDLPTPAQFSLGVTPNAGSLMWYVRSVGIEKDPVNGQFLGPALTLATIVGEVEDQYNVATHEFGHAFGVGHVEAHSNLAGDLMY